MFCFAEITTTIIPCKDLHKIFFAIAAINTNRNYICIEKDDHYFEVMSNRIANHDPNAPVKKPKVKAEVKGQLVLF